MKLLSLALLAMVLPAAASFAEGPDDEDDFDAAAIIKAFEAETGCSGIDVDGSKLDEVVQDRRCAVLNGYVYMLEAHGYCFDEAKQKWELCTPKK